MNEEPVHPWATHGEPVSDAYGANCSGVNEFGQRCPPKPIEYLHGFKTPRFFPLSDHTIREMVREHHRRTGQVATELHMRGPWRKERYKGLRVDELGLVGLTVHYEAEQNHVR